MGIRFFLRFNFPFFILIPSPFSIMASGRPLSCSADALRGETVICALSFWQGAYWFQNHCMPARYR